MDEQRVRLLIDTYVPTAALEHIGRLAIKASLLHQDLKNAHVMESQNKIGPGARQEIEQQAGQADQQLARMIADTLQLAEKAAKDEADLAAAPTTEAAPENPTPAAERSPSSSAAPETSGGPTAPSPIDGSSVPTDTEKPPAA